MRTHKIMLFVLCLSFFFPAAICRGQADVIDNGNGTFSLENGIYLRTYQGYSDESQVFLSALDACYSMIGAYAEIIDPYVNGEKSFADDQWNVINAEIRFMSGTACSWVMQNEVPEDLSGYTYEIFTAAYDLIIANDLLLNAIQSGEEHEAVLASLYFEEARANLAWWDSE